MVNIGVLSKHLGLGEPIKIGEDEIVLKPLGTESIPLFFKAMKAFSGMKEDSKPEEFINRLDEPTLTAISTLIDRTLEKSLPNEPEEDRKAFGLKYMIILLNAIIPLNMQTDSSHESIKKKELIEQFQKK